MSNFNRIFGPLNSPVPMSYLDDNFAQLEAASTSTVSITGAGLIGFLPSGTGAVAEPVQTALRRMVFSGQYGTIQQAVNAAGATGWVMISPNASLTETYTNNSNIPILDLRNTQMGLWSVLAPSFPVASFPGGNDLVLRTRGSADSYLEKLKTACTTAVSLAVGANTNFLVGAVTVGNTTRGNLQTGTTSLFSTSASLIIGRETTNEEVVTSANWSVVDGTHLSVTCAKTHAGTTDIEQLGSAILTAYDLYIDSARVRPSQNTTYNAPLRVKDTAGNIIAYLPGNTGDIAPYSLARWAAILSGAQGANNDLLFQHNTAASQIKFRNAAGNSNLVTLNNAGLVSLTGALARSTQSPAFTASLTIDATAGEKVFVGALTNNITINAPTGGVAGQELSFNFLQDGVGGRTVAWNSVFIRIAWSDTGNTANARSSIKFVCLDGTNWLQEGAQKAWS